MQAVGGRNRKRFKAERSRFKVPGQPPSIPQMLVPAVLALAAPNNTRPASWAANEALPPAVMPS
jgi:hypothetical protein